MTTKWEIGCGSRAVCLTRPGCGLYWEMQFSPLQRKSFAAHRGISFLFLKLERLVWVKRNRFLISELEGAARQRNWIWLLQALPWLLCPFCPDVLVPGLLFYRHLHNEGRFSEARYKNTLQLQIPLIVLKQGSGLRQWRILLFSVPERLCEQSRNVWMCWF